MLQYKSILLPDRKPYRITADIEYPVASSSMETVQKCVLITVIYPYLERQWLLTGGISIDKRELLNEINRFSRQYKVKYEDISIYPDPNGLEPSSAYNIYLGRPWIPRDHL